MNDKTQDRRSIFGLSRRRLLAGLAAASTAAAGGAAAAATVPAENPELIRLGDSLQSASEAHQKARRTQKTIVAEWGPQWPTAPDELLDGFGGNADMERSLTGAAITRPGRERPYRILTSDDVRREVETAKRALRRTFKRSHQGLTREQWEQHLAEWSGVLPAAEAYERETARIREASGYEAARNTTEHTAKALASLVASIMAEPDRTMQGVLIKAQALAEWGQAEFLYRAFHPGSDQWGPALAASIMRQATTAK